MLVVGFAFFFKVLVLLVFGDFLVGLVLLDDLTLLLSLDLDFCEADA